MLTAIARFPTRAAAGEISRTFHASCSLHLYCVCTAAALPAKYFPAAAAAAGGGSALDDFSAAHSTPLDAIMQYLPSDPQASSDVPDSDLEWMPTRLYDSAQRQYRADTSMRQSWTLSSSSSSSNDGAEGGAAAASGADTASGGTSLSAAEAAQQAAIARSHITMMLPTGVCRFAQDFLQSDGVAAELATAGRSGHGSINPPSDDASVHPGVAAAAAARQGAAWDSKVLPVVCKVLAYGAGGHFQPHMDAPRGHAGAAHAGAGYGVRWRRAHGDGARRAAVHGEGGRRVERHVRAAACDARCESCEERRACVADNAGVRGGSSGCGSA